LLAFKAGDSHVMLFINRPWLIPPALMVIPVAIVEQWHSCNKTQFTLHKSFVQIAMPRVGCAGQSLT